MSRISKRIQDIMYEKGLNRSEAAKVTQVPESSLQRYLSGYTKTIPSDKLAKIASGLEVPVNYLLEEGPFSAWNYVLFSPRIFLDAAKDPAGLWKLLYDFDTVRPEDVKLSDLISYIDNTIESMSFDTEENKWDIVYKRGLYPKNEEAPAESGEDLSEDKRYLVEKIMSLSDAEVRGLRAIVDQVLALRG